MQYTKILCGKLYNGLQDKLLTKQEILIEGNMIIEVGSNTATPKDCQIIDLSNLTVTPGLIDAHVHASFFNWQDIDKDCIYYSNGLRALAVAECARRTLAGGFTTIRHIGWFREDYSLDVKRAIAAGWQQGSRLIVAPHFLCAPGSHGDSSQSLATNKELSDFLEATYPTMGSGAQFFRNAVRKEIKQGADFIKIMATGGFFTPNDSPEDKQLADDELQAIIDTAHALHSTVTAHAYTPDLISTLANMGIDGIEHAAMIDKPTTSLLEQKNIYVVPTFCPYDEIVLLDEQRLAQKPPEFQRKLKHYRERLVEGRKILIDSNLKLGYGTDLVSCYQNYECGREFASWMRSGIDPYRILKAATLSNAQILGIDHLVGSIEPGKYADIAAWNRDLLKDQFALLDCQFVMKEGLAVMAQSWL